ncbi:MAG: flippase [Candidatus Promineifilaceae bacterium]
MNPVWRVVKNSSSLASIALIDRSVGFILLWYVVRTQSQETWGEYSIALAFVIVFMPFAFWGADILLPREIANRRSDTGSILGNAILITAAVSVPVVLVALAVTYVFDYSLELRQLIGIAIVTNIFPRAEARVVEAAVNGLEHMEWIAFIRLPTTIIRTILAVLFLANGYHIGVIFFLFAIQSLLVIAFLLIVLHVSIPGFRLRISRSVLRQIVILAVPLILIVFTGEAFKQVDRIFLSNWWDSETVGIYATAAIPTEVTRMVILASLTALFPPLSRAYVSSIERFADIGERLMKLILIGVFPVMITIISLAEWITVRLFGEQYLDSVAPMRILAISLIFTALSQLLFRMLIASNHEKLALNTAIVRSVVNLSLNVLLIPRYGVLGAGLSATVTELAGYLQNWRHISRSVIPINSRYALLRPGILVITCLVIYIPLALWNPIVAGVVILALFLSLLLVSKTISRQDITSLIDSNVHHDG